MQNADRFAIACHSIYSWFPCFSQINWGCTRKMKMYIRTLCLLLAWAMKIQIPLCTYLLAFFTFIELNSIFTIAHCTFAEYAPRIRHSQTNCLKLPHEREWRAFVPNARKKKNRCRKLKSTRIRSRIDIYIQRKLCLFSLQKIVTNTRQWLTVNRYCSRYWTHARRYMLVIC